MGIQIDGRIFKKTVALQFRTGKHNNIVRADDNITYSGTFTWDELVLLYHRQAGRQHR